MRNLKNEQGTTVSIVVGAILTIGAIVGIGSYVYSQNQKTMTSSADMEISNDTDELNTTDEATTATTKTGAFTGVGSKTGSGSVTLTKNADGSYVVDLGDDFNVQQGPDLFVSFANENAYEEGTAFAELKSLNGAQEYAVPGNINPENYAQVMIWCREFNAPFTVATLQ